MNIDDKNVLVLGGSGVLGSLIAAELASKGANVFSVARTRESATKIQDPVSLRLFADLENFESILSLTDYLDESTHIDGVLVASGAVGFGTVSNTSVSDAEKLMKINHNGPAQVIKSLLPKIFRSPQSFVGSITGIVAEKPFPGMAAYCASKSAHSAWLSSLRQENKSTGLKVFEFRPGHTETGLATRPLFGEAPIFPRGLVAIDVAQKIVKALEEDVETLGSNSF